MMLERLIKESYTAMYDRTLPSVAFGRVIVCNGRLFQELKLPKSDYFFHYENEVFGCWKLPDDRARLQLGSTQGEVFTTPPETTNAMAARVKEGGRCAREYMVRPFRHYDYHGDP